jgi:hypothetical protein
VASAVGTLLSAVNEGAALAGDKPGTATLLRVVANFVVPFLVASIGYLAPFRKRLTVTNEDGNCG